MDTVIESQSPWDGLLSKGDPIIVSPIICLDRTMDGRNVLFVVKELVESAFRNGYAISSVNNGIDLGKDVNDLAIENSRGQKAIFTFTKISSLCPTQR